MTEMKDTNFD